MTVGRIQLLSISGAFNPSKINSTKSWWDWSDTSTVTAVGTDMHQTNDKISNFAPMQGANVAFSTYPSYGLRTVSGLNTASMTHSDSLPFRNMGAPNWATGWPGAEGTIYIVCVCETSWSGETPVMFGVRDAYPVTTKVIELLSEDHYHLYFYPSAVANNVAMSRHGIESFSSFMDCLPHVYKVSWSVSQNKATFTGDGGLLFPTVTGTGYTTFGTTTVGGPEVGTLGIFGNSTGTLQIGEMTVHNAYIADGSTDDLNMLAYFRQKWKTPGQTISTTTTTQQGAMSAGAAISAIGIATDGTLFISPQNNPNCFRWNSGVNSRFDNVFSQTRVPSAAQAWGQGAPKCFDLAVAPSNSNRVYAVVSSLGSTTVWVSSDSGTTWTDTAHTVPFSAAPGAGPCVAVDPSNPDHVMIGCSNGHVHESSNAGSSWSDRTIGSGGTSYPCIVFESTTSIYIGWLAGATNILHSSNSGSTFSSPAGSGPTTVRGLCVSSDGVVYACDNGGGTTSAWKLASGTWSNFTSGTMTATGETWVFPAADPNNVGHVAFITTSGKLQYSTDYGVTWYTAPVPARTSFDGSLDVAWLVSPFVQDTVYPPNFGCTNSYTAGRILFDPHNSGRLYLSCANGLYYTSPALSGPITSIGTLVGGSGYTPASGTHTYFSIFLTGGAGNTSLANITVTNGAVSLAYLVTPGTGYHQNDLLSANASDIGGTGSGFSVTATIDDWFQQNKNQQGLQFNDLCRVPIQSNLMNNMLFVCQGRSGATPNAQRTEPTFIVGANSAVGVLTDSGLCCDWAKNNTLIQFMLTSSAAWRSVNFGADGFCGADGTSNLGAVPGIDSSPMMAVVDTTTLCILSGTGKKYSTNAITAPTWNDCSGLPAGSASNGRSHVLVNDGVTASTLYALIPSNGVYRSTDSGANWTQRTASSAALPSSYAQGSQLSGAPGQAGHLWFAGGNTGALPLARSTDGGTTWSAISNVTEAWQVSLGATKSGASYPTIFITGKIVGDSDPGVFRSTDTAATWTRVSRAPGGNLDAPNKLFADLDNYGTFFVSMGTTGYCFGELDYA